MAEMRDSQLDRFARIKFTKEKEPIQDARSRLEGLYEVEVTESMLLVQAASREKQMRTLARLGLIEVEGIDEHS